MEDAYSNVVRLARTQKGVMGRIYERLLTNKKF